MNLCASVCDLEKAWIGSLAEVEKFGQHGLAKRNPCHESLRKFRVNRLLELEKFR